MKALADPLRRRLLGAAVVAAAATEFGAAAAAPRPPVVAPAITLEGDANGAPHPDPASYAGKCTGRYAHRLIRGGVGHNLPQECPRDFAQAVTDVVEFG